MDRFFKTVSIFAVVMCLVATACGGEQQKVGLIVNVSDRAGSELKAHEADTRAVAQRFAGALKASGRLVAANGFENFHNKESVAEEARREADIKKNGNGYYEVSARLAKRFGIRYACMLNVERHDGGIEVAAVLYDTENEKSAQVRRASAFGGAAADMYKDVDGIIAGVIKDILERSGGSGK